MQIVFWRGATALPRTPHRRGEGARPHTATTYSSASSSQSIGHLFMYGDRFGCRTEESEYGWERLTPKRGQRLTLLIVTTSRYANNKEQLKMWRGVAQNTVTATFPAPGSNTIHASEMTMPNTAWQVGFCPYSLVYNHKWLC